MILNILYFPIRTIHILIISLAAFIHFGVASIFNRTQFDLGRFYQKNFERLGGTFIKVGQVLSVRYDILPREQCEALAKLQDNVKPFKASKGIDIINAQLGKAITGYEIDKKPFAAGSLCQVYKATNDEGHQIAIKVKRPLISAKMFSDTVFLSGVKYILLLTGIGRKVGASKLIDEVKEVLKNELDYNRESRQIELFSPIAEGITDLVVPKFYPLLSTNRVLTMDYLEGTPLSKFISQEPQDRAFDSNEVCKKIYQIYVRCMFGDGTFHADAHPGNIFVMNDGKIGIVDFGIIGVLNKEMRKKNFNYLLALSKAQTEKAAEIYSSILVPNYDSDKEGLLRDTKLELDIYLKRVQDPDSGLVEKSSANLYINSISFARKYNFTFPKNVFLFYKTLFTLDNVLLKLYPNFNAKKETARVLEDITHDKILEEFRFDNVLDKLRDIPDLVNAIPDLIRLSKKELEKEETEVEKNYLEYLKYALGSLFLISALLIPAFYFSKFSFFIDLNFWTMSCIAALCLLLSVRLKT